MTKKTGVVFIGGSMYEVYEFVKTALRKSCWSTDMLEVFVLYQFLESAIPLESRTGVRSNFVFIFNHPLIGVVSCNNHIVACRPEFAR